MAVNGVITWILKEKKATKRSLFFQLNFNYVYTNVDNIERARAREKQRERISLKEQRENCIALVRK